MIHLILLCYSIPLHQVDNATGLEDIRDSVLQVHLHLYLNLYLYLYHSCHIAPFLMGMPLIKGFLAQLPLISLVLPLI